MYMNLDCDKDLSDGVVVQDNQRASTNEMIQGWWFISVVQLVTDMTGDNWVDTGTIWNGLPKAWDRW